MSESSEFEELELEVELESLESAGELEVVDDDATEETSGDLLSDIQRC